MVVKKFNRSESAQKIHANRDGCHMHAPNFGGCDLSSFRDIVTLKNSQFSLSEDGLSSKNLIDRNRLKKFMQIGMDVTCMHTNFGGRDLSGFEDITTPKNGQFSLSDHGL